MSLLDSFRPKWKHNDPEVRAEAVRELEDSAALLEVARGDADIAIRRLAIKKLDDPRVLTELGTSDGDEGVRELATGRAREIRLAAASGANEDNARAALGELSAEWDLAEAAKHASLESIRLAALARISDVRVLADVARRGGEAATRIAALERIEDPALLIEVALHDPDKEVSEIVVAKVGDRAALEEIEKRGKSKRARAMASEKLSAMRAAARPPVPLPDIPPEKIREARLAQVCRRVEGADSDEELVAAQSAWAELGAGPDDGEYLARFERALADYAERKAARLKSETERAEAEAAREAASRAERDKAIAEAGDDEATRAALEARRKEEEDKKAAALVQLKRRFEEAALNLEGLATTDQLRAAERAVKRADTFLEQAQGLAAAERAELVEKLRAARDKIKVRALELREAEEWKRWANVPRLEELCAKVEALVEATDLKQAAHDLRSAQAEWKTLPAPRDKSEPLWHRFKHASDQVYGKCKAHFHELDEQRQAHLKQKEELCEKVEKLQDSTEWNATTDAIKKLQEEWKAVGPVPREQGDIVWKRFRTACDRFFDRRKEHFGQLDAQRDGNLKKLLELVEKAEAMADSTQWISTAEAIKKLQAEWKSVGPAPHKPGEAAWNRFRAACDKFFERRKAEFGKMDADRSENLKKKEDILVRLEAVLAGDAIPPALERIDHWMSEWKAVGPAPREQADAVWEKFREACDRLRDRTRKSTEARGARSDGPGGFGRGGAGRGGPGAGGPGRGGPGRGGPGRGDRDRGPRPERRDRDRGDRAPMTMSSSGPQFANKLPLQAIAARLKKAVESSAPVAEASAAPEPAEERATTNDTATAPPPPPVAGPETPSAG